MGGAGRGRGGGLVWGDRATGTARRENRGGERNADRHNLLLLLWRVVMTESGAHEG